MKRFLPTYSIGMGIAVAAFLLAVILLLSVRIRTVTVTGSTHYSQEQIEDMLFGEKWGRNPVYAYASYRFKPRRTIPFVEDYKLIFHSPFHVEVILYEKSIVGYVSYMSSYMYFDRDGIIVESSPDKLPDVPLVTGLEFGHIVLHQPLPVENPKIFEEILNLTQQLSLYEIQVDKIRFGQDGQASLMIGQMEVTLGGNNDLDGKISTLNDILTAQPQLKDIRGVLELEDYTESNSKAGITFKRK